jgi:hypothetical protein
MKWTFLLSLWLLPVFAQTQSSRPCLIISGDKRDHNGVFDRPMFKQETTKVGNHLCNVVDGWVEAVIIAEQFPPGDLLIIQGTHGASDGSYACNSGDVTADEVLTNLKRLSKRHRVGAAIDSCFSGEIMRKKLVNDQFDSKDLDKLCLVTSSQLGRITYGGDNDLSNVLARAKPGQTLEQVFLESNSGMISSAAWTEAGVPQYLTTKTTSAGMTVLQSLDQITRYDGICDSIVEANAAICASPSVRDEVFEMLMGFTDVTLKPDLVSFFHKNVQAKITELKTKKDVNGQKCYEGLLNFYHKKFGPDLESLTEITQLQPLETEFPQQSFYASCEAYKKTLPVGWHQNSVYFSSLYNAFHKYQEDQAKLTAIFSSHKFNDNFDMIAFGKAAAGDRGVCKPEDKNQILQSLLGESLFSNEYYEYSVPNAKQETPDENILGKKISTQLAMKGFQDASIRRNKPGNETDKARARACKEFKL